MNKCSFIALSVLAASFTIQANAVAATSTQISTNESSIVLLQGGDLLSEITGWSESDSSFTIDGGYLFENGIRLTAGTNMQFYDDEVTAPQYSYKTGLSLGIGYQF